VVAKVERRQDCCHIAANRRQDGRLFGEASKRLLIETKKQNKTHSEPYQHSFKMKKHILISFEQLVFQFFKNVIIIVSFEMECK
jgi:Flp pilus assembly protein TadD